LKFLVSLEFLNVSWGRKIASLHDAPGFSSICSSVQEGDLDAVDDLGLVFSARVMALKY